MVFANCIALFLSGAAVGAAIARGSTFGSSSWTAVSAGLVIAVIVCANLHRLVAQAGKATEIGNAV